MAVINSISFKVLATIIVIAAGATNSDNKFMVSGQCQGDMPGLIQQCSKYVQIPGQKVKPSLDCCKVVKTVDFLCVCHHITKDVEQIISMEKAVYVAGYCGKPIARGTKCGSYIVP